MKRFWVLARSTKTGRRSLVALALLLLFPLVASAAQDRTYRAPERNVAPPVRPHVLDLLASPNENSRQGLDKEFGPILLDRFLIKPPVQRGCDGAEDELSPGSTEYGFDGREKDSESGLQFFRARSYDPITGRFLSRDQYYESNLYYFVANDPVNKSDPSGTKWIRDARSWKWVNKGDGDTPIGQPGLRDYIEQGDFSMNAVKGLQLTDADAEAIFKISNLNTEGSAEEKRARAKRFLYFHTGTMQSLIPMLYKVCVDLNPVHFVAEKVVEVGFGKEIVPLKGHDLDPVERVEALEEGAKYVVVNGAFGIALSKLPGAIERGFSSPGASGSGAPSLPASAGNIFRSMKEGPDGMPVIARSARALGVRLEGIRVDVTPDAAGMVHPGEGMSVGIDTWTGLEPHRIPTSLGGEGKDPLWVLSTKDLPEGLSVRPKADPRNGLVEPTEPTPLGTFEKLLESTQLNWKLHTR